MTTNTALYCRHNGVLFAAVDNRPKVAADFKTRNELSAVYSKFENNNTVHMYVIFRFGFQRPSRPTITRNTNPLPSIAILMFLHYARGFCVQTTDLKFQNDFFDRKTKRIEIMEIVRGFK